MGMGIVQMEADVAGFPWGWEQILQNSRRDATKLCGIPVAV